MTEELQAAMAAIKAEDVEGAKLMLARLLQEEPDNVAAWVLLSKLAETKVQKAAFLRKILAIEPDHAYARQELAALQETGGDAEMSAAAERTPAAPVPYEEADEVEQEAESEEKGQPEEQVEALPISTDPFDYEAQAEGDTLPPWMADEEVILEAPKPAATSTSGEEAPEQGTEDGVAQEAESATPEEAGDDGESGAVAEAEGGEPAGAPKKVGSGAIQEGAAAGTGRGVLLGLTLATIVVFLLLIYAAITFLPDILSNIF